MAIDEKLPAPRDRSRIDIGRDWELRWWSKVFNASPEELKRAVAAVGPSVLAVAQHLDVPLEAEPPDSDTLYTTGPH
ncbi:DUF3606 domain-containing protein [uncultured Ferrovibrio sp.]|jgi:hypothetical protein|uniref:DUF3606 domain-containing protein n=1 Tax=uncultured Ferrovibrio sp. TaxID=1576913 RepID=UPI00262EB05F|nr:DUF3606 domain-containing protein [uncultured Ferrovibrio sp.]